MSSILIKQPPSSFSISSEQSRIALRAGIGGAINRSYERYSSAPNDGVTDASAFIQAEIDALPAGGGTLVVARPGTYLIEQIDVKAGTNLIASPGVTFKHKPQVNFGDWNAMFNVTGVDVTFRGGFTMDGNRLAHHASGFSDSWNPAGGGRGARAGIRADGEVYDLGGLVMEDIFFRNVYGACAGSWYVDDVHLTRCDAEDCYLEIGYLQHGTRVYARDNRANRLGTGGLVGTSANAGGFLMGSNTDFELIGNVLTNIERKLVKLGDNTNGLIRGNHLKTNSRLVGGGGGDLPAWSSIAVHGNCENIKIIDNYCEDVGAGFQVAAGTNNDIWVERLTVRDTYTGTGGAPDGVIIGSGTSCDDITILDCNFIDTRHGIQCNSNPSNFRVLGNKAYVSSLTTTGADYDPDVEEGNSWQ